METLTVQTGGMLYFFPPKYFFSLLEWYTFEFRKNIDENMNLQNFEFTYGVFKYTLYI